MFCKNSPIVRKCIIFAFNGRLSRLAPMVITGDQHYTYMFMYPNILFMYYNQIVLNKISSSSSSSGNLINKTYFDWLLFTGYSIISKGAY